MGAAQPDYIVLGDNTYGGVTPEQVKARAGWDALFRISRQDWQAYLNWYRECTGVAVRNQCEVTEVLPRFAA